jgi:nucleoid DNA-binding protein
VYAPRRNPHKVRSAKPAENQGVASGSDSRTNRRQATPTGPPRSRPGKGATIKKKELIERIAQETGVSEGEAQKHFQAFEQVVTEALKSGEEVRITGFGKFSVKERKAREGRNPQSGEKMKIAAQKVPAFSAGTALKEAV